MICNIAHRGARAFAPENTLEAIDKAASLGADMIEIDAQHTADGQLVIVHDDTLERCSDVRNRFPGRPDYRVGAFSAAEIAQLDAGSWFVEQLSLPAPSRHAFLQSLTESEALLHITAMESAHWASGSVRIPTLEQALDRALSHALAANIELKAPHNDCAALVAPVLTIAYRFWEPLQAARRHTSGMPPLLISSFDHDSLRMLHRASPDIPTALLSAKPLANPACYCRELGVVAYHPGCLGEFDAVGFDSETFRRTGELPHELFDELRAAGIAIQPWTENDPRRMRVLIEAGATGIFTDFPNRLREVATGASH